MSGHASQVSRNPSSAGGHSTGGAVDAKYNIPKNCKLEIQKESKVITLTEDFILAAHPYPQMEGELLLFQPNPDDTPQHNESNIVYRDYSLIKREKTQPKAKITSSLVKKRMIERDLQKTSLQSKEIDLETPLSTADWTNLVKIVKEISAFAWIQILPEGQKSSMPMQFNSMHVIPSNRIDAPFTPLDKMISNKITYLGKHKKAEKDGKLSGYNHYNLHKNENLAKERNLILVDELQFPHAIYKITEKELTMEGLKFAYNQIYEFLKLKEKQDWGITICMSPSWLFVGALNRPYHIEKQPVGEDIPVYLDGFAYAGHFNLQDIR